MQRIILIGFFLLGTTFGLWPAEYALAQQVNDGIDVSKDDWPWWRGPQRNGAAFAEQDPPLTWSESTNVAWKAKVPGRGHSCPTVAGNRIYLSTCDETKGSQSVLCYDRDSGAPLWQTEVHQSGAMRKNEKASSASSTIACDGERIFVNFPNNGALYTTALTLAGERIWQTKITDYVEHQGYGSSPAIYQSLVIVSADNKGGGAVAGLDRKSGSFIWRNTRPKVPNYASPIILNVAGKDQLLLTGCDLVSSLEPLTGKTIWEIEGATTECVTSTVTDGKHVFSSGGYPRNHLAAIVADGSGSIAWDLNDRVYVPSLLVRDGYLYGVMDAGVAACWKCDTGGEVWKARLGGTFSASPVLLGDKVFATNEEGVTFIFRATPKEFERLGQNQLGDQVFATPVICGGRIYMRVTHHDDNKRQEMLYCLAKDKTEK
jgi:hypothetical protein